MNVLPDQRKPFPELNDIWVKRYKNSVAIVYLDRHKRYVDHFVGQHAPSWVGNVLYGFRIKKCK